MDAVVHTSSRLLLINSSNAGILTVAFSHRKLGQKEKLHHGRDGWLSQRRQEFPNQHDARRHAGTCRDL